MGSWAGRLRILVIAIATIMFIVQILPVSAETPAADEICKDAAERAFVSIDPLREYKQTNREIAVSRPNSGGNSCDVSITYNNYFFSLGNPVPPAIKQHHEALVTNMVRRIIKDGYDPRKLKMDVTVNAKVLLMPRKIEKGFVASEQEKIPEARTCSIGSVKYSYLLDEVRWHDDDPYTNCSWAGPGRAPPG